MRPRRRAVSAVHTFEFVARRNTGCAGKLPYSMHKREVSKPPCSHPAGSPLSSKDADLTQVKVTQDNTGRGNAMNPAAGMCRTALTSNERHWRTTAGTH